MIAEPSFTEADVLALQAMLNGVANETQQKHFMGWLYSELFQMDVDATPIAESDREVFHSAGRRFCGMWIKKLASPDAVKIAHNRKPRPTK